jgi:hypothetical protein
MLNETKQCITNFQKGSEQNKFKSVCQNVSKLRTLKI